VTSAMSPQVRIARVVRLFTLLGLLQPLLAHSRTVVKSDSLILTTDNQKYDFVMRPNSENTSGCATRPPLRAKSGGPKNEVAHPPEDTMGRLIIYRGAWDSFCESSMRASQYPASGLYHHGGSKVPIWTVDWHEVDVVVSEDGHHLSRLAWNYGPDLNHPAIIFYEDGKEIRSWSMKDLVKNNPLCLLKDGWYYGVDLEDHSGEKIRVSTRRGQSILFKLTTGEMVERTVSDCSFQMPRLPDFQLMSPTTHDLRDLQENEHEMIKFLALLIISVGILIVLLHSRKEYKDRNRTDD
jgi:hypothetical protein